MGHLSRVLVEFEHLQDKLEKLLKKKEKESLLAGCFSFTESVTKMTTIRKEWNACGCLVVNPNAKDLTVRHLITRHIETSDGDRLID